MLSIIVIIDRDRAIGRAGDQPYHISGDFRHFKALTLGHPVIMGRRTFEALPKGALPGRLNVVVSRNPQWSAPDTVRAASLEDAIRLTADAEPFVIGGAQIYAQALPLASDLYLTEVDASTADADTFFPEINPADWQEVDCSEDMTDERSGLTYRFLHLRRKQ